MVSDDALLRGGMFSAVPVEPERAVEPIVESVVSAPLISARTGLRLRRPGAPHWSEMFSGEVYSAPLDGAGGPAPQYERMPTEAEFMEGFEPYVEPAPEPEPIKPAYRNPPSTLQEWQRLNPGMVTKPQQVEEEVDIEYEGEGRSALEDWESAQKLREESDSPDELIGFDKDGIPIWKRVQTGGDVLPPTGHPPSGDGAVDKAMDIYRGSADNYPHDAPLDEQQGFAVAASTQDYNKGGWANEAPVAAQTVEYDGRRGEVREYAKGNRFFVSFADDVILRMHDKK